MRVIFLDIDGVLNSDEYDRTRNPNDRENIDKTRLVLLKKLVKRTRANIVLSSSWRKHWDKDESNCDRIGTELNEIFGEYGLKIFDKTPTLDHFDRADEIRAWLEQHGNDTISFVILDDEFAGWGDLSEHLVRTNYRIGRGLEKCHIKKAKKLLRSGKNRLHGT